MNDELPPRVRSKEDLAAFVDEVGGTRTDVHGDPGRELFAIVPPYAQDDGTDPIEVEWIPGDGGATIRVTSSGDGSFGTTHQTEAPAEEWAISQTDDDGNLLTTLETAGADSVECSISAYGPPVDE